MVPTAALMATGRFSNAQARQTLHQGSSLRSVIAAALSS